MPTYMIQFAYTADAWATLAKNPQDRSEGVGALAKKLGGRMLSMYYSFGEYDGVVITELPDDVAAAAVAIAATTPGHLKSIRTTPLLTLTEAMDAMRKAGAANYQAPKG